MATAYTVLSRTTRRADCAICGDTTWCDRLEYWDADDGWHAGPVCAGCVRLLRPSHPDDYAYAETDGGSYTEDADDEDTFA